MCTANNSAATTEAAASSSFWKNPSFWKSAGSGLAVGAGIMGATGQYIAGNAQRDSYYAQAAAIESQAALSQQAANRQVKYDLQNAAQSVKEIRRAGRQNYAKQLTAAAGSGMDFSSVSFQDAVLDSLRAENEDIDLYRAAGSYHIEREMFDANVGYGFSFMAQAKDGYLQAPGLTFYQPFYKTRSFKKIYELPAGPLIREIRYVDGIDLLEQGLAADAFPLDIDPFGDALRPLFKEAWLFDEEGTDYAYFDWGKLRLSLGEARREHLSTIQSAGSL